MSCVLRGLVREGVFGEGRVGSPGTDAGLDAGEFTAEGCFAVGGGRVDGG